MCMLKLNYMKSGFYFILSWIKFFLCTYRIDKVRRMIDLLKQERCTWSLLNTLYKDRLEADMQAGGVEEEGMIVDSLVHWGVGGCGSGWVLP